MNAASIEAGSTSKMSLGHVALHYKSPEDGPNAARLLDLMGFRRLQEIPLPNGSIFYQFLVNDDRLVDGVGTLYLTLRPKLLEALNLAIREALKVGTPQKHPAVQALSREQEINPEVGFHIDIMVDAGRFGFDDGAIKGYQRERTGHQWPSEIYGQPGQAWRSRDRRVNGSLTNLPRRNPSLLWV